MSADGTAFGWPGMEPRWARGDKDGIGTAYAASARIWFTLWAGIITEVYFPRVDRPQLRDLQYLATDGETFLHEEKRHLVSSYERLESNTLGFHVVNCDPEGRYAIFKEIITDPHLACVLQRTRIEGQEAFLSKLRLYALCAPHLEVGGWGNNGYVREISGRKVLMAQKGGTWLALGATIPFSRTSCGYVAASDGWTDLADNLQMDWEFQQAPDGNIALTGELDLARGREFILGLAFGDSEHAALSNLSQSLATPFERQRERFVVQWGRAAAKLLPLDRASGDNGRLYRSSFSLLRAHEDKSFPGAFIASLAIPWGETQGDNDQGGYHLVWTRDMVNTATGALAAGDCETPLRALIYLSVSQQANGGFPQNFWLTGDPYWRGVQLDEVAFPVMLAWRLHQHRALTDFDHYPLVMRAAAFLAEQGPVTQQERWEEASGYSPSTLASNIAALIGAACMIRERGDEETAAFLEDYADFLECHIEAWTVTTEGTLRPEIPRHYIRVLPASVSGPHEVENPNRGMLGINNRPPGSQWLFPAKEIVDAGFLELVRYGIRKPDDPIIMDSLRVVDEVLRVETPFGPCWRRYNHDGYGQRADGGPYEGWGRGRAWPLLTGERGHYELAAGNDVTPFIRTLECFASSAGLLPEQVWDKPDRPEIHMFLGRPTGSAMPLMWAHAEYIKLLRSAYDGKVFDLFPEVANRYLGTRKHCRQFEVWKLNRQVQSVNRESTLRIQASAPFLLHWTNDEWSTPVDTSARATTLGLHFVDIPIAREQQAPIRFTFLWTTQGRWEGRDYTVVVK